MSEKRRDSRGRILRNGEIQMADGKYRYKYKDLFGETKYAYSWRWIRMTGFRQEGRWNRPCAKKKNR